MSINLLKQLDEKRYKLEKKMFIMTTKVATELPRLL